jgi:transposase
MHFQFMLALISHSPDIYLDEIQDQLYEQHDINTSLSTIWETLKRLGITSKKVCDATLTSFGWDLQCCSYPRRLLSGAKWPGVIFRLRLEQKPPSGWFARMKVLSTYWPLIGRTGGHIKDSQHKGGLALLEACGKHAALITGTGLDSLGVSYSLLPAITTTGIIYSHIKVGGYNGDEFLEWLDGLLMVMNPYPAPHSVLVLDNCRIHHVDGVQERCDERCAVSSWMYLWNWMRLHRGVKLIYLPPYSPDLNPIEECFSFVKSFIRRRGLEFRNIVESGDVAAPYLFLYNALEHVTADHSRGWFHHSGYIN